MSKILKITFCLACLSLSNILLAETEVSVFAGYRGGGEFEEINTGEKLSITEDESTGFSIWWTYDENTFIEVLYSHQEAQLTSSTAPTDVLIDLDIDYFHFGGVYQWPGTNKAKPYLSGTIGVTHYSPETGGYDSKSRASLGLGLGTRINLTKNLGLKFEGKGFATVLDSGGAIFCNNGNCRIVAAGSAIWQYQLQAGLSYSF